VSDLDNSLDWLAALKWDADGMIPAIAQDESGRVVMFAYMNRESLQETIAAATRYTGRDQKRLWRKGEESGTSRK
jgi:phosphoribosyl-AMP cyclohydrolase